MQKSVYHLHHSSEDYNNTGWEQGFRLHGYRYQKLDYLSQLNVVNEYILAQRILQDVQQQRPDYVFLELREECPVFSNKDFMEELMRLTYVVVFSSRYQPDYTDYLLSVPANLYFVSNNSDYTELWLAGKNVHHCYSCYDSSVYKPILLPQKDYRKYGMVIFVGNIYSESPKIPKAGVRKTMVEHLMLRYGPDVFQAYGIGTPNGHISKHEAVAAYHNAKVVIGHNSYTVHDYQSDRMFKAIAAGALFLPHYTPVTRGDNLWTINSSWNTISGLCNMLDEIIDNEKVEYAIKKEQQAEIKNHDPVKKISEIEKYLPFL